MGAFGVATMWEAVFADVGVALLATLNAARILRTGERKRAEYPPADEATEQGGGLPAAPLYHSLSARPDSTSMLMCCWM